MSRSSFSSLGARLLLPALLAPLLLLALVFRDAHQVAWTSLIGVSLLVLCALTVLRLANERLLRQVRPLVDVTKRLAGGDLSARANVHQGPLELRELTRAIDEMAGALERREAALRQAEARYRTLVDQIPAITYIAALDSVSSTLYTSPQSEVLLGFAPSEWLSDPELWLKQLHPDDRERVLALLHHCQASGEPFRSEHRLLSRDGQVLWFRDEAVVLRDEAGQPQYLQGVLLDITERKRAEAQIHELNTQLEQRVAQRTAELEAINTELQNEIAERKQVEQKLNYSNARLTILTEQLSRSRNLLRALFDGLDDGMLLLDRCGNVLAVNQAFASLLATTPQSLVAQRWATLCSRDGFVFPSEFVLQTLHDGRVRRRREHFCAPGSQNRILDMQALPLFNRAGAVDQIIVHVVDVTERLKLEALAVQGERLAASGKLAATIAHELNTPLQSIKSCLYLAGSGEQARREKYLAVACEELDRVSGILRQMLHLHRPGDTALVLVDFSAIVERVLLLTGRMLADRGITVERSLMPDPPLLWGRADQLTQVLLNLILNAADAMPEGGLLRLSLCVRDLSPLDHQQRAAETPQLDSLASGPQLVFAIQDTGIGVEPEVQTRIFAPFFTTKPEGSGLGLAIVQKIVAQHDGKIEVRSAPGAGTTFTIVFPINAQQDRLSEAA